MTFGRAVFLLCAAALAGAVNAVAGGGSLLSFPAAIAAGLPPIVANATNAAALVPGSFASAWTYRRSLDGLGRLTILLGIPAVAGALIGAAILRHTPQRLFDAVVPGLVAGATLLILLQGALGRRGGGQGDARGGAGAVPPMAPTLAPAVAPTGIGPWLAMAMVAQLVVSVYGGYFGAAMGILMLAYLGVLGATGRFGLDSVHQMNAVKNVLAVVINGVASIDFVVHGLVRADAALIMATGSIAGGILGARAARRTPARTVRRLVIAIGFAMAALLAYRRYA